jgi:D-sedoheptulose 7-phosphate isomerase
MRFSDYVDYGKVLSPINSIRTPDLEGSLDIVANLIVEAVKEKRRIFFIGNGGSAAEASHFAAELVSKCVLDHEPWAAISLTDSSPILTAIGNDFGFDYVFSRQLEALAREGDLVMAFTTSGKSKNVILALAKSEELKCNSVLFTGQSCPSNLTSKYLSVIAPSFDTPRIQEIHLLWIHLLSEYCENAMINSL